MRVPKRSAAILSTVFLIATASPSLAGSLSPQNAVEADYAQVVPTQQEVQQQLNLVAHRLHTLQLASVDVRQAQAEYLKAERDYNFGRYIEALDHAGAAQSALPPTPNWIDSQTAAE